ncbi:MAG: hypothetical protein ACO3A1_02665 [Flavobacteriaceae bacterium]
MKKSIIIIAAILFSCKNDIQISKDSKITTSIDELELLGKWKIFKVFVDGVEQDQQSLTTIEFGAYQKYIGFDSKEYIYGITNDSIIILDKTGNKVTSSQIIQESDDKISLLTELPDGRIIKQSLIKE